MIVNRDGQNALRVVLTDYIFVELGFKLFRRKQRHFVGQCFRVLLQLFAANSDAIVANIDVVTGRGNQMLDFGFRFTAERATGLVVSDILFCHLRYKIS